MGATRANGCFKDFGCLHDIIITKGEGWRWCVKAVDCELGICGIYLVKPVAPHPH
jgi:hypothetical protein